MPIPPAIRGSKNEQRIYRLAAWQGQAQGFAQPRLPVQKFTFLERLECVSVSLLGKDLQNGVATCPGISVSNQIGLERLLCRVCSPCLLSI